MSKKGKVPPVAPPRVRKPLDKDALTRLSKSTPMSPTGEEEKSDEEDVLFNRLQAFYNHHEPERVGLGIGHIVNWTLQHGEKELNQRLTNKYGENLTQFERRMAAELNEMERKNPGSTRMAESFMMDYGDGSSTDSAGNDYDYGYGYDFGYQNGGAGGNGGGGGGVAAAAPTIRERLLDFYRVYDPSRLQSGVDDLVEYISRVGFFFFFFGHDCSLSF